MKATDETPTVSTSEEKDSDEFKKPSLKKRAADDGDEAPDAKKPKERKLKFESTYLRSIPSATQYEKSFMHRDVITHVIATESTRLQNRCGIYSTSRLEHAFSASLV
ncbi:hypothetical protein Y032_0064g3568 [Ancylostoma ceylanicum]|uniref:Uncharacterized protein n=1 Tax=Ancylostoma ceylanicum TaxID=53326 RepID=A0A016U170_9BILA|nr:hypothetical protein Y032_0064g3568 [Ancylostoma ceylanicum]